MSQEPRTILTGWQIERRCVDCSTEVSDREYAYSRGVCPHCGRMEDRSTFLKVTNHVYRLVLLGKWWQFWRPVVKEYRKEETK